MRLIKYISVLFIIPPYSNVSAQFDLNIPSFNFDLTGQPKGNWISPNIFRDDECYCSASQTFIEPVIIKKMYN